MEKLRYQDFHIQLSRVGRRTRRCRVSAKSSMGNATAEFTQPFKPQEQQSLIEQGPTLDEADLEKMGKNLFSALFTNEVAVLFKRSWTSARNQRSGLRIKLNDTTGTLAWVPWELLRRPDFDVAMASSYWSPLVRQLEVPADLSPLALNGKLKVLLVSANPAGQDPLDIDKEAADIAQALAPLDSAVEITHLDHARRETLKPALYSQFHIVHFMLHGEFDRETRQGQLLLEDPEPLTSADLRQVLVDCQDLRLVVFNTCESARTDTARVFAGMATAAIQAGVPAVIAMQYAITDDAARYFSKELYLRLAEGYPIEQAVANARGSLQFNMPGSGEWMTPVLYMVSANGVLFEGAPTGIPPYSREGDLSAQAAITETVHNAKLPAREAVELRLELSDAGIAASFGDRSARADARVFDPQLWQRYKQLTDANTMSADDAAAIGRSLFEKLVPGELEPLYRHAVEQAGKNTLRMTMVSDNVDLLRLPWEYLQDPDRGTFIALAGARRPIRRCLRLKHPPQLTPFSLPLRILFVSCLPMDMPPLNLEREWNWIETGLKEFGGQVEAKLMTDPTPAQVHAELESGEYHIFHFLGYDSWGMTRGAKREGIILVDDNAVRREVEAEELANLLQVCGSLRLVVLNTCFNAHDAAPILVRSGIPRVIAMKGSVSDEVAIRFSHAFYPLLLRGNLQVDTALAAARAAVYSETNATFPVDWAHPSLYTCLESEPYF